MAQEDRELTSLSWLHDRNLLKDATGGDRPHACTSVNARQREINLVTSSLSLLETRRPNHLNIPFLPSYNPERDISCRPPFSFPMMVFMAIEDTLEKALSINGIYKWIKERFLYYRKASGDTKGCVRSALYSSKYFRRLERLPSNVTIWGVKPSYRPILVDALNRSQFHIGCKIWNSNNKLTRELEKTCDNLATDVNSKSNSPQDSFSRMSRGIASVPIGSVLPKQQQETGAKMISCSGNQDKSVIILPCKDEWYHQLRGDRNGIVPSFDDVFSKKKKSSKNKSALRSQRVAAISSQDKEHNYCSDPELAYCKPGKENGDLVKDKASVFLVDYPVLASEIKSKEDLKIPEDRFVEIVCDVRST